METKRQALHRLVDALPDDSLQSAEEALKYCAHPTERRLSLEYAERRVREMALKYKASSIQNAGSSHITSTTSTGMTKPNGDFRGSMSAWDGQRPVTYQMLIFRGHKFEIFEYLEMGNDNLELVFTQRFVSPNGSEQVLTIRMAVSDIVKW